MQPRILIVYTGGTIGMTEDLSTGALVPFSFDHLMKNVPKIGRLGFNLDHVEMNPPIDSSNMNPACWARIASVIADRYEDFDGFVVLHGTDTMAYTASALSFMLPGLAKPVVLTGSQLPIGEIREDGTENLITALQIAAARTDAGAPMVQEVAISFGRHLWRGNRSDEGQLHELRRLPIVQLSALADMDLHIVFRERLLARPAAGGSPGTGAFHGRCGVGGVSVSRHHRGGAAAPAGIEGREGRRAAHVRRRQRAHRVVVHRAYCRYGARGKGGRERDPVPLRAVWRRNATPPATLWRAPASCPVTI